MAFRRTPVKQPTPDEVLAELAARIKDAGRKPNIKKYRPHPKQYIFHTSVRKRKLYIGGNRSGKTTGGVVEDIWRATNTHPYRPELNAIGPNFGRVVATDFDHGVAQVLLPQFSQWLYPSALINGSWEDSYNKSTKLLTLANKSSIEFMSYDQDLDKFAGTSRHWIHFDEEPPRNIWVECLARLVDTDGDWHMTMTPVEGMNWIYDELYEGQVNNPEAEVEVIEVSTLENPYLSESGIKGLISVIDSDDVQTRIGGAFVQQGGKIYKNFDPTVGGQHVLSDDIDEPVKLFPQRNWLWIMGLDHGLNNPTAVLWMAVDPAGYCVVFDEYYRSERTIDQNAEAIKEIIRRHGRFPDLLVADPSIQNRSPITGTSIHEEYQKLGLSFILGNNDVKAGIVRTKKYLNSHKYVGTKKWMLDSVPAASDEFPMLRFSPRCEKTIWELKRYRWKTYQNKKLQYENNPYDEPHKKDDHAADALRYIIMTRPDLTSNSGDLSEDKVNGIMEGIQKKIAMYQDTNLADPNELTSPERGWNPDLNIPTETTWEYDEHMGGIM